MDLNIDFRGSAEKVFRHVTSNSWNMFCLLLLFRFALFLPSGFAPDNFREDGFMSLWLAASFMVFTERTGFVRLPSFFPSMFAQIQTTIKSSCSFEEVINNVAEAPDSTFPHQVFNVSRETCACGDKLTWNRVPERRFIKCMLYSSTSGPRTCRSYRKKCEKCKITYYSDYSSEDSGKVGNQTSIFYRKSKLKADSTFVSTRQTYFDVAFMVELDTQFLYNQASFNGATEAYNEKWYKLMSTDGRTNYVEYLSSDDGRWLSRRTLEDAWFRWTLSNFLRNNGVLESVDLGGTREDLDALLLKFYPEYEKQFEMEFGSHLCDTPGCELAMVGDGHLKNRRSVCWTRNINFVAMSGFPGGGFYKGCTNQPQPKSRYCRECNKFVVSQCGTGDNDLAELQAETASLTISPRVLRSQNRVQDSDRVQNESEQVHTESTDAQQGWVRKIVDHRTKGNKKSNKVQYKIRWQEEGRADEWRYASDLPSYVVSDYWRKVSCSTRVPLLQRSKKDGPPLALS